MTTWQIWMEGFNDMGNRQGAQLLDSVEAETFDDAVRAHIASLPKVPDYPGGSPAAAYYRQDEDGSWRMWGCKLHSDETEARKNDAHLLGRD